MTDFLIVLDAEREVLNTRDELAQAQTDTATALVSVYQALGGRRLPWLRNNRAARQFQPPDGALRGLFLILRRKQ